MNGANIVLFPPVAFSIFLGLGWLLLKFGEALAATGEESSGKRTAYACGEDVPGVKVAPDYQVFFPYALFFTIIHVTALILATIPGGNTAFLGILYILGVCVSLYTLIGR